MNISSLKENFMTKSTRTTTTSKKITLSSPPELPKNSNAHISKINGEIETVELAERTLVSHLKDCKTLIDQIREKSDNSADELNKNLLDTFKQISDVFTNQVKIQNQENEKVQQKVEKLKQEKNELQRLVVECSKRCTHLEEELGKYPC